MTYLDFNQMLFNVFQRIYKYVYELKYMNIPKMSPVTAAGEVIYGATEDRGHSSVYLGM